MRWRRKMGGRKGEEEGSKGREGEMEVEDGRREKD